MSLIHEALKKAEQQRRLGEPPTLASPFSSPRRRPNLLVVLVPSIALALGIGWWLMRDDGTSAPTSETASTSPDSGTPASTAPAARGGGLAAQNSAALEPAARSSAAERRPVARTPGPSGYVPPPAAMTGSGMPLNRNRVDATPRAPTVKEIAERESEPQPAGANPLAPGESAPLKLGDGATATTINDPAELAVKQAVKQSEGDVSGAAVATVPPPAAPKGATATAPTPIAEAPPAATPPPAAATPVAPATPAPPPTTANAAAPAAAPPVETGLPFYWQLPYNLRKDLPVLTVSMHVYSPTPPERFVVLNGNRQVEGDALEGEMTLIEIRADGVVIEFRGQRFLVPRSGS